MTTKSTILTTIVGVFALAFGLANASFATADPEPRSENPAPSPYIGVKLDPNPLPEVLSTHLRLKPNQGLVVYNVQLGSPADQAGIERHDIIVGFQGRDVNDYREFVQAIQQAGVGTTVELEIIHQGERKTIPLALAAKPAGSELEWKYPFEAPPEQRFRPGRIFRRLPGDPDWRQMPYGPAPDPDRRIKRFFQQRYSYQFDDGKTQIEITIDGDPRHEDTPLSVKGENVEFHTTVGQIDQLDAPYRDFAAKAIDNARQAARLSPPVPGGQGDLDFPERGPDFFDDFFDRGLPDRDRPGLAPDRGQEDMREQLRSLQQRMEEMEELQKELREQLNKGTETK